LKEISRDNQSEKQKMIQKKYLKTADLLDFIGSQS